MRNVGFKFLTIVKDETIYLNDQVSLKYKCNSLFPVGLWSKIFTQSPYLSSVKTSRKPNLDEFELELNLLQI